MSSAAARHRDIFRAKLRAGDECWGGTKDYSGFCAWFTIPSSWVGLRAWSSKCAIGAKFRRPLSVVLFLCLFAGCTIIPKPVAPFVASIGQSGTADSGIVARVAGGYEIDARLRDRYNALIVRYGAEPAFQPPLVADDGVTVKADGRIVLDREGMRRLALMNGWRRAGRLPTPKPGLIQRLLQ